MVTTPSKVPAPVVVSTLVLGGEALAVAVDGDHAFVVTGLNGLMVVEVSDPTAPEIAGWIVELDALGGVARLYPDWREQRRFGGSVGPGPVLVLARCGSDCLQVMGWRDGAWHEIGEPLAAASSATAYPTRDGDGVPWVVLSRQPARVAEIAQQGIRRSAWFAAAIALALTAAMSSLAFTTVIRPLRRLLEAQKKLVGADFKAQGSDGERWSEAVEIGGCIFRLMWVAVVANI